MPYMIDPRSTADIDPEEINTPLIGPQITAEARNTIHPATGTFTTRESKAPEDADSQAKPNVNAKVVGGIRREKAIGAEWVTPSSGLVMQSTASHSRESLDSRGLSR